LCYKYPDYQFWRKFIFCQNLCLHLNVRARPDNEAQPVISNLTLRPEGLQCIPKGKLSLLFTFIPRNGFYEKNNQ
jgi:hypothetical protein